jgi:hypothetical protein
MPIARFIGASNAMIVNPITCSVIACIGRAT